MPHFAARREQIALDDGVAERLEELDVRRDRCGAPGGVPVELLRRDRRRVDEDVVERDRGRVAADRHDVIHPGVTVGLARLGHEVHHERHPRPRSGD